jgi:hypothetical protein
MENHTITNKQSEILTLLYKFRFLNRKQIQTMLNHKYPSRIFNWLDELKEKEYLNYSYQKNFDNLPAVYSLGKNGMKYLRRDKSIGKKIDKVRKEAKCSTRFIDHCLFIADIHLSLLSFAQSNKAKLNFYTKTDLSGVEHLISPHPDAYFAIEAKNGNIKRYILEIFNENLRTNILRQRVKAYLTYYDSDDWQDNTNKPFPEIILVCPTVKLKNHIYFYLKNKLDRKEPIFYLSVKENIAINGLVPEVLEKVKINNED